MSKELTKSEKRVIAKVFCLSVSKGFARIDELKNEMNLDMDMLKELIKRVEGKGLVATKDNKVWITDEGRKRIKVVLAGGVFDIIHPGHIYTLSKAKEFGDVLIVSVARNLTVLKFKNKLPINDEKVRKELVSSLKYVDLALLGSEVNIFETVERVKPDVIVLGYDQKHSEDELIKEADKRSLRFQVIRLSSPFPHLKSSEIKKEEENLRSI
jgi:cytidyltransferase-like protein